MGQVAITFRIMPENPSTDLEAIKKSINSKFSDKVKNVNIKPIAFGLKMIEVLFVLPDKGGTDEIESFLQKIKGVASVETGDITLL
jgi:translation elongation factor aEF-1 beta